MFSKADFTVGDAVAAFHPGRLGVVNVGIVKTVGTKYLHLDFGALLGGTWKVPYRDVIEIDVPLDRL
jgi:hypothetical protein